ncbi:hypothetical protein BH10PSE3_BH10PSE3_17140 [soil metagenome]
MTALACLKVTIGEELRFGDNETMAAVVAKVAGAYLETTWLWPRRFGLVAPFSFVLADPRATQLDARELQALARALQHRLFGDAGQGEIALLMFEGDQADVMRFAGIPAQQVAALLAGEDDGTFLGRVCKITPTEVSSIVPKGGPVVGEPPMEDLAQEPLTPSRPVSPPAASSTQAARSSSAMSRCGARSRRRRHLASSRPRPTAMWPSTTSLPYAARWPTWTSWRLASCSSRSASRP